VLVERDARLGGVCLNRGCIPSKALLHAAKLIDEAKESSFRGIHFEAPRLDLNQMRTWKDSVIEKLAGGVRTLAQNRGVEVVVGKAYFEDSRTLRVETASGQQMVTFGKAIVAVGSRPAMPAAFDLGNPRVMTSTEALEIEQIPEKLLVVGGGYIGMELGTVYGTLGSEVIVVEALPQVLAGADQDLVRPVLRRAARLFKEIRTSVKVLKMATAGKQIKVDIEMNGEKREECTTACWCPWVALRIAETSDWRTRRSPVTRRGSSRLTSISRPPIRASSPSAMWWAASCWHTRLRRRRALRSMR
jgi:dihydrolipoamide dehydrogenase